MRKFWLIIFAAISFYGCNRNPATEFVRDISCYSDFSTVDWAELSNRYYRPNTADWNSEMDGKIIEEFPLVIASEYWHLLQNARTDFHQKSLPLRTEATDKVIKALDKTEAAFDSVFVRCVSQEYYLRLFAEMYNETIKPAIDELVSEMNSSISAPQRD